MSDPCLTATPPAALLSAQLWQAARPVPLRPVLPTGHAALDAVLADGGWPRGALTELLLARPGSGELPLLLPALAGGGGGGPVMLLDPPWVPCLEGWRAAGIGSLWWVEPPDARSWLWSAEQVARTSGCPLLAWPGRCPLGMRELRRLQLAAQEGGNLVVLLRPAEAAMQPSPAALRLRLDPLADGRLQVQIRKQRGGFGGARLVLTPGPAPRRHAPWPWPMPVTRTPTEEPGHAVARPVLARAPAGALADGDAGRA